MINRIFRGVQIKEQGYNATLSVLKLSQHYPNDRFEDACQIALGNASSPRYKYLKAILSGNQDLVLRDRRAKAMPKENQETDDADDAYVRGAEYYGGGASDDQ